MRTLFFPFLLAVYGTLSAGQVDIDREIYFGVWSPFTTRWVVRTPLCIWTQEAETSFRLSATGANSSSEFVLESDVPIDQVRYRVSWRADTGPRRLERLRPGRLSVGTYAYSNDQHCGGGTNGILTVRLVKRDIDRAAPGIYDDELLLMLAPI